MFYTPLEHSYCKVINAVCVYVGFGAVSGEGVYFWAVNVRHEAERHAIKDHTGGFVEPDAPVHASVNVSPLACNDGCGLVLLLVSVCLILLSLARTLLATVRQVNVSTPPL